MFQCGAKRSRAGSSIKWHNTCFHGNQTFDSTLLDPSPAKKLRTTLSTTNDENILRTSRRLPVTHKKATRKLSQTEKRKNYRKTRKSVQNIKPMNNKIDDNQAKNSFEKSNNICLEDQKNPDNVGSDAKLDLVNLEGVTLSSISDSDYGSFEAVGTSIPETPGLCQQSASGLENTEYSECSSSICTVQLRLAILVSDTNKLTLHLQKIRGLSTTDHSDSQLYITTMVIPDENQNTLCQMQVSSASGNNAVVVMDEKITYDMKGVEDPKRIMISAWQNDSKRSCSEMRGCMSFGIKNLLSKGKKKEIPVDGWYSFLPENFGQSLNLDEQNYSESEVKENKENEKKLAKKLDEFQKITVSLPRTSSGYGFTIKGSTPVRVGRVKPGGTGETQGLLAGDRILSINNRDVTLTSVETVTKIVKHSAHELHMLIARPPSRRFASASGATTGCFPLACGPSGNPKQSNLESRKTTQDSAKSSEVTQSLDAAERLSSWGSNFSKGTVADLSNTHQWQPELSVIREEKTINMSNKINNASTIPRANHPSRLVRHSTIREDDQDHIYEEIETPDLRKAQSYNTMTPETVSSFEPESYTDTDNTAAPPRHLPKGRRPKAAPINPALQKMWNYYGNEESSVCTTVASHASWQPAMAEESRRHGPFSSEDDSLFSVEGEARLLPIGMRHCRPVQQESFSQQGEIGVPADRQVSIHQLLTCEEDFCRLMKRGIQRFSRPLRHQILSRAQHAMLFQNIEKLVALTEFHIHNLIQNSFSAEDTYMSVSDNVMVDHVGSIYRPKIQMICEVYKVYCEGLGNALELLESFRQMPEFYKFQQRTENMRGFELSLSEFLQQPLAHFQQLVGSLGRVLLTTPTDHPDHSNIKYVMEAIHMSVTTNAPAPCHHENPPHPNFYSNKKSSTPMSSHYNERPHEAKDNMKRSELSMSRSSLASIDGELLDLQQKMLFANHVKPFQLAVPTRHIIFSGDLISLFDHESVPLWAVLCSDLLVLTHKDTEGRLTVTDEPIPLSQVVEADFSCEHVCEFRLLIQTEPSACSSSNHQPSLPIYKVRERALRTTSPEQKWAWKTLLEQRIKSCRSQSDSAFSSMDEYV